MTKGRNFWRKCLAGELTPWHPKVSNELETYSRKTLLEELGAIHSELQPLRERIAFLTEHANALQQELLRRQLLSAPVERVSRKRSSGQKAAVSRLLTTLPADKAKALRELLNL